MEGVCHGCRKLLSSEETCVLKDGHLYCCLGCARNTRCTCVQAQGERDRQSLRRSRAVPLEAFLNEHLS